ncbi:MAG: RND family transporter [bacterium]|nr:RND family transporter [bacterium]
MRWHKQKLLIILAATILFLVFNARQEFFNTVDIYFNEGDKSLEQYRAFRETYGNEELVLIAFKSEKGVFTREYIDLVRAISVELREIEHVQKVHSLTEQQESAGTGDTIEMRQLIPEKEELDAAYLNRVKKRALANKNIVDNIVSKDGKTTAIIAELEPLPSTEEKNRVIFTIQERVKKISGTRYRPYFAGNPYVQAQMNILTKKDLQLFLPLSFVLIFFVIFLMLRDLALTVLCQVNMLLSLIWALGLMSLCGETINVVTTVLGPIILAISVADSIHMLAHYKNARENSEPHEEAVRGTTASLWQPCLFTSLTTGIGFFSFAVSSIRPVRVLGMFTAFGILLAFLLTFTFLPAMLELLRKKFSGKEYGNPGKKAGEQKGGMQRLLEKPGIYSIKHYVIVCFAGLLLTGAGIAGIGKIGYNSNMLTYLPEENPVKQDMNFIEENLGGTIPFVLLIRARTAENDFTRYKSLKLLDEVQQEILKDYPQFTTSRSLVDYYKEMNKTMHNNEDRYYALPRQREDILELQELCDYNAISRNVSPGWQEAKISFRSRWSSNDRARESQKEIARYLDKKLGAGYTSHFTGYYSLFVDVALNLKESQVKSFVITFSIIFIMMLFVFRNVKLAMVSMFPNLFPIVLTLGIMGWTGIPLDVTTIMIAGITMGLAVDDTIHYTTWFLRNYESGMEVREALVKTYSDVGRPILITTIVLFAGFFILVLGQIQPTKIFGLLTAFSMLFALIGDLFLYPALLYCFRGFLFKKDISVRLK